MANHLAFQAGRKPAPRLAMRMAVAYQSASINLRSCFRAALAFLPSIPPAPVAPLPVAPPPTVQSNLFNLPLGIGSPGNPNPYGVDILCVNDLDPFFSLVGGIQVLAQDLFHRITSSPGSVPGAPSFGFNTRLLLNQSITKSDLSQIQSSMVAQLQADERVQTATALVEYSNGTLTVSATVLPLNPQGSSQPFRFVASISTIGAQLVSVSPVLT